MLYRRFCAAALAAICIISAINGADAQCQVRPRREIRRLSRRDREAYFSAIRQLQSTGSPSLYDDYTRRHLDAHEAAHGTAQFLPWHRWFIHDFEVALQRINSNIMIPYWDWSIDSQQPAASPIFRSDWYGGNGNPQADYCVQDGKFADYRPAYPEPHCLRRRFDNGRRLSAFYSPPQIDSVLQATTYSEFKRQLEGPPHALVHINIGSNLADISTMYSPNE
ncbi:hypothetical protein BDF22DRAFT_620632 [Syncephalis plumigaleata]|nr:hypothetical protein BDF22DRAFT_620632 [Syncephalis plumigaleata]